MRHYHKTLNQFWRPVINLDKLIVSVAAFWMPSVPLTRACAADAHPGGPEGATG